MTPYHTLETNKLGFWITKDNKHVIRAFVADPEKASLQVQNWSTGEAYWLPRVVVAEFDPVPDHNIEWTFTELGLWAHLEACFALKAVLTLPNYTVRGGKIDWGTKASSLQLDVPPAAATVDTLREAVIEVAGTSIWTRVFAQASRTAFLRACGEVTPAYGRLEAMVEHGMAAGYAGPVGPSEPLPEPVEKAFDPSLPKRRTFPSAEFSPLVQYFRKDGYALGRQGDAWGWTPEQTSNVACRYALRHYGDEVRVAFGQPGAPTRARSFVEASVEEQIYTMAVLVAKEPMVALPQMPTPR